ncbi:MAG: hypothetical protein ACTTGU_06980 [Moraxella sp.]
MMNIFLYQIWYDEHSQPNNNSGLYGFDCRHNPEFLKREVAHLIRFYDEIVCNGEDSDYFSLLSPRFCEKTGLRIQQVHNFIKDNKGYDIYLFNPYPMNVYCNFNVWDHGEDNHTGLKEITNKLFDMAGFDFNVNTPHRNNIYTTVYCNYWVASKVFFDDFINLLKLLDFTIDSMATEERSKYFSETTYRTKASFYPFIFERIICSYLLKNPQIRSLPYIYQNNFNGYNKMRSIEKAFYFSQERQYFDDWEKNNSLKLIKQGYNVIHELLYPKVDICKFKFANKWLRSIIRQNNKRKIHLISNKLSNIY